MKKLLCFLIALLSTLSAKSQTLYFPPSSGNAWDTLSPASLNWCEQEIDELYNFLDVNNTKAFILLKDGKVVLEKYFGGHTQSSAWYWASAGKSLTGFLVGIAQQEKALSVSDVTSKYLGNGWTNCTSTQEGKITIRHQLSMTTGLDDGVPDHFCTLDTCLNYKADAGTRWAYHNGPYTLLDKVIENATGKNLNVFVTQKLKNPTGITGAFVPVEYNNVFYSNARSMARFGLLILNKGNWDGIQILSDEDYFKQMTHASQELNKAYGYLWWLNGSSSFMVPNSQFTFNGPLFPNAPSDLIAAMGKNGQFINVVPSENLVWIRMGEASDETEVPFLMNNQIWEYLNRLKCEALSVNPNALIRKSIDFYPNPVAQTLTVSVGEEVLAIELYNSSGKIVKNIGVKRGDYLINVDDLRSGIYWCRVSFANGEVISEKIVKE